MLRKATRTITLALTIALLTATAGKAIAQSSTPSNPTSGTSTPPPPTDPSTGVVSGTDPEPDYVGIILSLLHLA